MIHVDVSTDPRERGAIDLPRVLVQTSVDGGPWRTQYVFHANADAALTVGPKYAKDDQRLRAEDAARIFINGCRFAGAEVRGTSFGYAL